MVEQYSHSASAANSFGGSRYDAILGNFFGVDLVEISKALATSGSIGVDGSGLNGYDLDKLIRYATLDETVNTPKLMRYHTFDAKALTSEWNRLISRGNLEGNWRAEGNLGKTESSRISRVTKSQKFMGRVGAVTRELQEAAGGSFGDAKAFELKTQLEAFMLNLERDTWHADSSFNSLAPDGIIKQMDTSTEFNTDMANTSGGKVVSGGNLSLGDVRGIVHLPIQYGGSFTSLYCSPQERVNFGSDQDPNLRFYKQDVPSALGVGIKVDQLSNEFGSDIDIIWDLTLGGPRGKYKHTPEDPSDADKFHSDAPAQPPAMTTANPTAASGGYLPDDEYFYGVAFVNEAGEGPIRMNANGGVATGSNNKINVTVDLPSGAAFSNIRSIRLYRSTTSGADYTKMRLLKEVALSGSAGGTQVIADDGSIIPGSREAIAIDERNVGLIALEKPVAADLPRIDNTHRFSIDGMCTFALYVQQHIHRFYNIGGSVTDPA